MNDNDILLAQLGNEESIEKIIIHYQKTIFKNNFKLFLKGGDKDDLIQEGIIGLLKAIKSYDPYRNTSFNTFSNLCIKRQILTSIQIYDSKKNKILNNLNIFNNDINIDDFSTYSIPSAKFYSPEEILLSKELTKDFLKNVNINFSDLEKKIFINLCKGYTYIEISNILNITSKKTDNTIQRVRKKIFKYIHNYRNGEE